jgi:hypothetical protein
MAETLEIEAEEHPISFGDILLRKFGGRYELSVHFWSKDDDSPNLRPYSLYAGVGVPLPHFCFIVPNY